MNPRAASWPILLAVGFLALGLAGLSGSSGWFGSEHDRLLGPERSRRVEVFARSRGIRSDEWAVEQPMARAQQLADPAFPSVNLGLGLGQLMRNPYALPVLDWGAAFRFVPGDPGHRGVDPRAVSSRGRGPGSA
jgi:hypothetical protein